MKFLYGIGGANIPVIAEFEVEKDTVLYAGETVGLENGVVTKNLDGGVLGVCAENHSGKEDILNARANGTRIRVDITTGGVYRTAAPEITTIICGGTSVTVSADEVSGSLEGAKLVLCYKEQNSESTDAVGSMFEVVSCTENGENLVLTLDGRCDVLLGDRFRVLPATGSEITLGGTGTKMTVVGRNVENGCLDVTLSNRIFG